MKIASEEIRTIVVKAYGKHIAERLENSLTGSVEEGIKRRYQN